MHRLRCTGESAPVFTCIGGARCASGECTVSQRITVTLPDDVDDRLPYDEHDSKSATIVHYLEAGLEAEAGEAALQDELESVRAERDDLRRQLQEATRRERDLDEIVAYAETEREIERQRLEREQEREAAPLWRRAKWWVLGRDVDGDCEGDE